MQSSSKPTSSEPLAQSSIAQPLRFGQVGLGGYGKHVLRCLQEASALENPLVQLTAVCDPDVTRFKTEMDELRAQGLTVYTRFEDLLADQQVQAVWLPVPISLHRKFTVAALEAGKAVLCEKPAAATVDEVDLMITARDRFQHVAAIGFQDVYDPLVQDAKRRILAGELGQISRTSVWGVWPRDSIYYGRNAWAGAQQHNGQWVLDSPASNAMSHFITLMLYLLGPTQETAAVPISIEAELYRANAIQSYDTCGLRVTVEGGVTLLILLTHAGGKECPPEVVLTGDRGTLTFTGRESMTWAVNGITTTHERAEPFAPMIQSFARRVAGDSQSVIATLETSRQHVTIVNGAAAASPIHSVPGEYVETPHRANGTTSKVIIGIESALAACAAQGKLPHESGLCPWTHPAQSLDLTNYRHFTAPR